MQYFSTNRVAPHAGFREAVLGGQPDDKGLYYPEFIPILPDSFLVDFRAMSRDEIAFEVIRPFVAGDIDRDSLTRICADTVAFDFPLIGITGRISALELFHGPTLAFKDVGARFMSGCLGYFSRERERKTIVVVATSGDTGGAVANGFHGTEGVEVVILYPKGRVSEVQERQLTTLGGNIAALEVDGNFDDCQSLAKTALADTELKNRVFLTSANSINVARWLPQQFYYFFALQQWLAENERPPVICVPSGNFGNICAGLLAGASGLPFARFIAATNVNDVVPKFMATGQMTERASVATLSNAMDVAHPSNFARVLELFGGDRLGLAEKMDVASVTDEMTAATMREVFSKSGYFLDPHGAVGYHALDSYLAMHPEDAGFFLETAHPVKFDSVAAILGTAPEMPAAVRDLFRRPKQYTPIKCDYDELRQFLESRT